MIRNTPQGMAASAGQRYTNMVGSGYAPEGIANWLTSGIYSMAKGAVAPEDPFSEEHWLNSFGTASVLFGGYKVGRTVQVQHQNILKQPNFVSGKQLSSHFVKHQSEFGGIYQTPHQYLQGARSVMNTGYEVNYMYKAELRTGYVQYMGNTRRGVSKFAFVGTNNSGYITTYHVETGKSFWKMLNGENIPVINPVYYRR